MCLKGLVTAAFGHSIWKNGRCVSAPSLHRVNLIINECLSSTVGSDYTEPMVTTVTFEPDETSASHSVPIVDDTDPESDENFAAVLTTTESNVNIGGDTAIVNILDDDRKLLLQ